MKILVVDDSTASRYALRLRLQRHGAVVETAASAEAALQQVKESSPDAVFMDRTMPGMNGFEALDILKASPETSGIPVVMCTSREDPEFIAQARRKGALGVLSKTAAVGELSDLLARIAEVIAGVSDRPPLSTQTERVPDLSHAASELIRTEADRLIGERLNAILDQRLGFAVDAFMNSQRERLTAEVLAPAVNQLLEEERRNLARMVQERIDRSLESLSEDPAFIGRLLDHAGSTALKTTEEAARQRAHDRIDALVSERLDGLHDALRRTARADLRLTYGLAAVAAIVGIGASGLVYLAVT
jgi:CheY-like chemotaxis protein